MDQGWHVVPATFTLPGLPGIHEHFRITPGTADFDRPFGALEREEPVSHVCPDMPAAMAGDTTACVTTFHDQRTDNVAY